MDLSSLLRTRANAPNTADKIIVHGNSGAGKSSLLAHAPSPIFVPAQGEESGIAKLAAAGLVPDTVRWLPEIRYEEGGVKSGWGQLLQTIADIYKSLDVLKPSHVVLDCADDEGFLRMGYEHHAVQAYEGDMGENGFMAFSRGYRTAIPEVKQLTHRYLQALVNKGVNVVLLMHSTVSTYKNPFGADYTRYIPLVDQKYVWPMLAGWADMVLFLDTQTTVVRDGDKGKGKARGSGSRILYCEHRPTHEAKNRHGLPAQLILPAEPEQAYPTLMGAMNTNNCSAAATEE